MKSNKASSAKILIALVLLIVGGWFALEPISGLADKYLNDVVGGTSLKVSDHARDLHARILIVDLHADSLLWHRDLVRRNARGHVDVPRLIEGNVAVQAFTIVTKVPSHLAMENNRADSDDIGLLAFVEKWPLQTFAKLSERAFYQARKLFAFADRSDGQLVILKSKGDLRMYLGRRKIDRKCVAGFLGVEGAHALDGDLANVDKFFDAGIRMMAPTHFFDNDIASSAHGLLHGGLTEKGKEMIRRMQEKHMIVDLAHASPGTIRDVLAIATAPVVVSHTGVKGTCDSVRNLSDEELQGIAKTGGVVGIGYWQEAVCGNDASAIAKAMRHAARVAGIDHVALGSDFDGTAAVPFDVANLVQLTQAMINEGFTDAEIEKIMGQNALRVLSQALPD